MKSLKEYVNEEDFVRDISSHGPHLDESLCCNRGRINTRVLLGLLAFPKTRDDICAVIKEEENEYRDKRGHDRIQTVYLVMERYNPKGEVIYHDVMEVMSQYLPSTRNIGIEEIVEEDKDIILRLRNFGKSTEVCDSKNYTGRIEYKHNKKDLGLR